MKPTIKPYLISITTEGIKNITKPITVRFYKNKSLVNFNPSSDKVRAIYGANGAGKTAFMTSIWLVHQLLTSKDTITLLGSEYFQNILNKEKPIFNISIDYALITKKDNEVYEINKTYRYFIKIDGTNKSDIKITDEGLYVFNGQYEKSKLLTVFECKNGKVTSLLGFVNKKEIPIDIEEISNKALNIISKQSFVTFLIDYLFELKTKTNQKFHLKNYDKDLISIIYFASSLKVRLANDDKHQEYFDINKNIVNNFIQLPDNEMRSFLLERKLEKIGEKIFVKKESFDAFQKHVKKQAQFIQLFKPDLKSIEIDKVESKDYYICSQIMNYGSYKISFDFESTGIKRLLSMYSLLNEASRGGIVFIDEIDVNISGVYLQRLVQYLNEYGNGQLCFTAHSLDPMYILNNSSKSIYFINDNKEILSWTKNANYKPYILYPEGMIKGIMFPLEYFDFTKVFDN